MEGKKTLVFFLHCAAKRPPIALGAVFSSLDGLDYLGSNVLWCADRDIGINESLGVGTRRRAEIRELDVSLAIEQDVGRLDVSVDGNTF